MLSETLVSDFLTVKQTTGVTQLLGEETDLLVLLCHHAKSEPRKLIMKSAKSNSERGESDIGTLIHELGEEICHILPTIHTLGG